MSEKKVALIVPTIRENCMVDFVKRWQDIGLFEHVDLHIMEDNPTDTFDIGEGLDQEKAFSYNHYSWESIKEDLDLDEWIIPRRSDTVRSYAYWKVANSNKYEYILTLDDDCYPCTEADGLKYNGEAFINEHIKALEGRTRWFNTLNSVKPRGIPFQNLGVNQNVILNHGLWTKVLDYDAPYQLANPIAEKFSFDNRVVPAGFYFPMCGMNVMWKSSQTVLMYHMLMGRRLTMLPGVFDADKDGLTKLPFDRFGDIWTGIIMKKIADHQGKVVTTGMPYIRHERASNPFTNLRKEANGIEVNEKFWQVVDNIDLWEYEHQKGAATTAELYWYIGCVLPDQMTLLFPEHAEYFRILGKAMVTWANLFREI